MDDFSVLIIWMASIAATFYFSKKWNQNWKLWGGLSIILGPIAALIVGILRYHDNKDEIERKIKEQQEEAERQAEEARRQAELEEHRRIEAERIALQKEAEEEYLLEKAEKIAIIKEALSEADIREQIVSAANCPSCGATFKAVGSVAVCPYCESVVSVE